MQNLDRRVARRRARENFVPIHLFLCPSVLNHPPYPHALMTAHSVHFISLLDPFLREF